eukprot:scaffold70631_cov55-Phaeocystis_antarctica.AAC.5
MAMRTGNPTTAPNGTAVGLTAAREKWAGWKTIAHGAARGRSAPAPWRFASCGVCRGVRPGRFHCGVMVARGACEGTMQEGEDTPPRVGLQTITPQ